MNRLTTKDRAKILAVLCEGMGVNAACRITGANKGTVLKLLAEVGEACALYQDRVLTGINSTRIECDEIWSFVSMKQKNVPEEHANTFGYGDVYTWTAIDADSKLMVCWNVGTRSQQAANVFMNDLAPRLTQRIQLTTDGLGAYVKAVEGAFGRNVDFAQIVKQYGFDTKSSKKEQMQTRYSPAVCTGTVKNVISGNPDPGLISTSYVERSNLTMRMHMRRFTRLTNGFSKKLENHMHSISLYFMFYNFCKIHKTLRVTPAMEAGIADHVWSLEEAIEMSDTNT